MLTLADVPPAPRRPSPRARKLIFRYTGAQWVLRMVGAIFLAIGLVFVIPFTWGLPSDVLIAVRQQEVPGRLLRLGKASYSVNEETPTRVFYAYDVGGRQYEGASDVFSTSDFSLDNPDAERGALPVQVSTLAPSYSRITGTRHALFGPLGLLTLLFPALGGVVLFFAIRSNHREVRAFVHGVPVLAEVVSLAEDYSTSVNGKHPLRLAWEFRADDHQVYEGSLSSMQHLEFEELRGADRVVVLYDPQRPQANTLYVAD